MVGRAIYKIESRGILKVEPIFRPVTTELWKLKHPLKSEKLGPRCVFIGRKNKQAFNVFDPKLVRASNCQSEQFVSKPYLQWSHK